MTTQDNRPGQDYDAQMRRSIESRKTRKADQNQTRSTSESQTSDELLLRNSPNLPEAYWLYSVVGNIAIFIVVGAILGTEIPHVPMINWLFYVAWLGYNAWVQLLIWNAAEAYTGRPIWKGLAKAAVILSWAYIGVAIIGLLRFLYQPQQGLQSPRGIMEQLLW